MGVLRHHRPAHNGGLTMPHLFRFGAGTRRLLDVDLTSMPLSSSSNGTSNTNLLKAMGIVFARASAGTVQVSASALVNAIGTDVPRIGTNGVVASCLVFEESRIQRCQRATFTDPTSLAGTSTVTQNYDTGPYGVANSAERCQTPSGTAGLNLIRSGQAASVYYIGSGWYKQSAGGANSSQIIIGATGVAGGAFTTGASWARYFTLPLIDTSTNRGLFVADGRNWSGVGGTTAGARDVTFDCMQTEDGRFPTEWINSYPANVDTTRAGERIYTAVPMVDNGRLGFYARLYAKGSVGGSYDYQNAMRLWTIDASNYAEMAITTGIVTVVIGGSSYSTPLGFTFSRTDDVELWCEAGGGGLNTVVKARKNGGATTTLGTSGSPQSSIASPTSIDLLCNGTSAQFSAWVRRITAYPYNTRPSWA